MGIKVTQNRSGVSASVKVIEEKIEERVKGRCRDIAETLVAYSPVWSGAYVTSHSFVPKGSGGGRSRKSRKQDGPVSAESMKSIALNQLYADIEGVNIIKTGGGVFRNRAPHASKVEYGRTPAGQAYGVYTKTVNNNR